MESWGFDYVTAADTLSAGEMGMLDFGNATAMENRSSEEMRFGSSLFNPVMAVFSEEHESSSKELNSIFKSNCKVSGQFDCNFDKMVNQENLLMFSSSKITNILSLSEVSMPSPFCQVNGCNKKLVSCKDYYKRHKVCELHSKSAKVTVSGIQQRFCQQCSRFHILSEFDSGKRSCRRRLADHNQRRRKNQANSKPKGSARSKETSSFIWHVELEDEVICNLQSMDSLTDVQLQYSSLHGSDSIFYPFINEDQTGCTDNILTEDPTPALSSLPSQSDSASSCHSSRTTKIVPLSHTVHQACGGSNNMNPLVATESMNHKTQVWSNDEPTIDLLQLSSELKRVFAPEGNHPYEVC